MSIFSAEGRLALVLNRIGDLIVLNIAVLVCMLLVVTAGAAFTSLYEISMKMVKNEEGQVLSSYIRAFRDNFKKSTLIWLVGGGLCVFLILDIRLLRSFEAEWSMYYRVILLVFALLVMLFTAFALITAARFENTLKNTVKNGILFCVIHFLKSLLMFVVMMLPVILVCISSRFWCVIALFGFSGPAFLTSVYFRSLFKEFE